MLTKTDLIDSYVDNVLDSMDMDCLLDYAKQKLYEQYEEMGEKEFIGMVKEYAPELIDEE